MNEDQINEHLYITRSTRAGGRGDIMIINPGDQHTFPMQDVEEGLSKPGRWVGGACSELKGAIVSLP